MATDLWLRSVLRVLIATDVFSVASKGLRAYIDTLDQSSGGSDLFAGILSDRQPSASYRLDRLVCHRAIDPIRLEVAVVNATSHLALNSRLTSCGESRFITINILVSSNRGNWQCHYRNMRIFHIILKFLSGHRLLGFYNQTSGSMASNARFPTCLRTLRLLLARDTRIASLELVIFRLGGHTDKVGTLA